MKHTFLIRIGGLALIVGGVVYAVASILGDPFSMADVPRNWARVFKVSFVLFLLGVMAAIVALHFLQRERYGREGAFASAACVGVVGVALSFGFDFWFLRFAKEVYLFGGRIELLIFLGLVGTLVGIIGIVALGIFTLQARVLPWWCGLALIAGNPFFEVFLFFFGLDNLYGTWPVVVPWVVVGVAVFLAATRQTQQPSRLLVKE
jgi:hypothetical protein